MKIITDKFLSAVVLTAAALCTSCSTDSLTAQQQGQNEAKGVSLTATMDEAVTRAGIGKSGTKGKALCYWHKGDQISVQTVNTSGNTYSSTKFYTTDATGATTATFWSEPLSEETLGKYALYPYNEKHQFTSETELTYNLPASYTYTTVGTDIFSNTTDGTYPSNSTNVPLLGTVDSENNNITFSHLGGLVVIRIDAMPYEAGTLTVSADQQLSGNFTVADLTASDAKIATTTTDTEADKTVTFTFSGASQGNVGVFYLPVATGSYSGVTIKVTCGETTQTINYGNLYVARAGVTAIPLYTHDRKLSKFSAIDGNVYTLNGHKFIDLGLSVLWATMNVGAESETGYGDYFAWGEIESQNPKTYSWDAYKYGTNSNLTKYNGTDQLTTLEAADDAATANWGAGVRMPTYDEFVALLNGCTLTTESGYARRFTGKDGYTGSSIFLPAGNGYVNSQAYNGSGGNYWSSTLNSDKSKAHCLTFTDSSIWHDADDRSEAHTVRAVTEK